MEANLGELMVSNAVYVAAARVIHTYKDKTVNDAYPYYYLKNYTTKSKAPSKPVLISRASTSISLMLPFFRPSIKSPTPSDAALFGKISVSGVGVSLNNNEYENTGVRKPFGTIVTVPSLIPHEKYVFAAAAYCEDGTCPHGIGETSDEFVTLLPLSLGQIFTYLADISYKLQSYDIAKDAAEKLCAKVINRNELRCNLLDSRINPVLAYSLNKEYANLLSLAEVRHIANAFLILGKSLSHLRNKRLEIMKAKGIAPSLVQIEDQKASLKVCSYLMVGIEAASRVKDYYLLKLMVIQIYNTLSDFFQSQAQSPLLLHALIKCHVALTIIPANCLDGAARAVASCITYQIAMATIQINETKLLNSVLANDLIVMRRRWLTKTVKKVTPPEPLSEQQQKLKEEQEKKLAAGEVVPEGELVKEPEATEELMVGVYEGEKEGEAADEFFLTLGQYNDKVALNIQKWKAILSEYVEILTEGKSVVTELTGKLDSIVKFWQQVGSDPYAAFQQLIKDGKASNSKYLEFCCKCLRRMLEHDGWSESNDLLPRVDAVELDGELKADVENSLTEQSKQLENDVLEKAIRRLQTLEKLWNENKDQSKESLKEKVTKAMAKRQSETVSAIGDGKEKTMEAEAAKKENFKWLAELHYLKGAVVFEKYKKQFRSGKCKGNANYFDIKQLDFERIKTLLEDDDDKLSKREASSSDPLFSDFVLSQAKGCLYALHSNSPRLLHNLIVQLWNFLLYTQASPAVHKKLGTWNHIIIISYSVLGILGSESTNVKQVRFKDNSGGKQAFPILYANLISYSVQCLLIVEKWMSLADLCQRFNHKTDNEYGGYLLPFTIYAQGVLYKRSEKNTTEKQEELKARIEAFQKWAATKKKKSRAAMITGEIPPEEQEFNRDKKMLEEEILKLSVIQEFAAEDKLRSEELLALIKRDSSTAKEALTNCRKSLIDYAQKTCEILTEERTKGKDNVEVKKLQKVHQMITNKVVNSYRKTIELLRERQENFMLVQALHELANIYFAEHKLKEAEIHWSDSLDTVYQELYVLNNFKNLAKRAPNLVAKFGMKPCLNSLILLSKLHKFSYGNDLHKLSQAVEMALYVAFEPFKLTMPHPQQFNLFALYKCTELFPRMQLFDDNFELSGADLIQSLDYITTLGLDYEEYERNLPALALMQYVARAGCYSNEYLLRARVKQSISLANIGYIQEAIASYQTVVDNKDLVEIGARSSMHTESTKGMYSTKYEGLYHNGLTPYDEPNKKTLGDLLNAEMDRSAFTTFNLAFTKYAKCAIMFKVYENEPVSGASANERQDDRFRVMRRLEEELRETLKILSRLEEIAQKKHAVELALIKMEAGEKKPEELERRQKELERAKEEEGIDIEVSGEKEFVDVKNDILTLMVHCRMLLGKIFQVQGLYTDAYNSLNTGVNNLRKYCWGITKMETGIDTKSEVQMVPEGVVAGLGAPGAKDNKKAPPAKEEKKKKESKKKPNAPEPVFEEEKKSDEEKRQEELLAEEQNSVAESRLHINPHLWFKLRFELLNNIYLQEKYDDCEILIKSLLEDAERLKDVYFRRLAQQVKCYILVRRGKHEEAEKMFTEVVKSAKHYGQNDARLAYFTGNIAEMFYKFKKDPKVVIDLLKESRIILWQLLKNYGLELDPIDINKENYKDGVFIDPKGHLKDDSYLQAGEKIVPELTHGPQEGTFDYSKELTHSLQYPDKAKNSSYIEPNIYLSCLEQLIKIDIRYATAVMADGNYETAVRVLSDTLALTKRTLNVPPSLPFTVLLLSAIANKEIFKAKLWGFANTYIAKAKTNKKYEKFAKKVPFGKEVPLGEQLFKLPMFSHKIYMEYWKSIENAYQSIKYAVELINEESVLLYDFEERLNATKAFFEYSDVCRIMSEYCPRKVYHFTDYKKHFKEELMKKNPNLSEEELDKKITDEIEKDEAEYKLKKSNYASESINALSQAIKCEKIRKALIDGYPELAQTTLIDPSRAPKDIICEIFESDYHSKKLYKDLPSIETKPKTVLSSADILAYYTSLANELKFFSFGKEVQFRRLSKLHRYLKTNLSTYATQCCISYKPFEPATSLEKIPAQSANAVVSLWSTDGYLKNSIGLYALGPMEGTSPETFLGEIVPEGKDLGKLYQEAQDLLKSFNESSGKSEQVFTRDKEKMRPKFVEIVRKIGDLFAPRSATESFSREIMKLIPEFTAANLKEIVGYLGIYGTSIEHVGMCGLLKLYHQIRYNLFEKSDDCEY